MIVLDASAAVAGLEGHPLARELMADEPLHAPSHIDLEVLSVLRRRAAAGRVPEDAARRTASVWLALGLTRHHPVSVAARVWELRHTVSPYDAAYVALAESLGCPLLTADARLSRAPGIRCAVTLLPLR